MEYGSFYSKFHTYYVNKITQFLNKLQYSVSNLKGIASWENRSSSGGTWKLALYDPKNCTQGRKVGKGLRATALIQKCSW